MDKRVLIRLSIAMSVGVLLLVNVAATYETYGRDGYLYEKFQAAVEAGKITQEQADEKLEKIHSMKGEYWKDRKPNYSRKSIP